MPSGAAIQSRIAAVLRKMNATSRIVSLRQVTETGGDPQIGLPGQVTFTDTVADPQPAVSLVSAEEVGASGGFYQLGDYKLIFSGTTPETSLRTSLLLYGDEVLKVTRINPMAVSGLVVAWEVMARSVKPGS
jgi:hypothetical protein